MPVSPDQVAIVIAAYNAEATIARAVRSALDEAQVAEVIVVDDASIDHTIAAAKACDDGSGRLAIVSQPRNQGPSVARNRALGHATSPWIGVLDADDFFLPGRIAGLLDYAADVDMVADDMWKVPDSEIDGPRRSLIDGRLELPKSVDFREFVLSNVTQRRGYRAELGFIKPLMRREFLEKHGLRYREEMHLGEDFELYARALALGARLLLVPAQGYVSVVRANSLSGLHSADDLKHLRDGDQLLQAEISLAEGDKAALRNHYLSIDCRLQWRLLIQAVKDRNLKAAAGTFLRPWPVPAYLAGKLLEQVYERGLKRKSS